MVKRIVMADDVTGEFDGVVKDQLNTAIGDRAWRTAFYDDFTAKPDGEVQTGDLSDSGYAYGVRLGGTDANPSATPPVISGGALTHVRSDLGKQESFYLTVDLADPDKPDLRASRIGVDFTVPEGADPAESLVLIVSLEDWAYPASNGDARSPAAAHFVFNEIDSNFETYLLGESPVNRPFNDIGPAWQRGVRSQISAEFRGNRVAVTMPDGRVLLSPEDDRYDTYRGASLAWQLLAPIGASTQVRIHRIWGDVEERNSLDSQAVQRFELAKVAATPGRLLAAGKTANANSQVALTNSVSATLFSLAGVAVPPSKRIRVSGLIQIVQTIPTTQADNPSLYIRCEATSSSYFGIQTIKSGTKTPYNGSGAAYTITNLLPFEVDIDLSAFAQGNLVTINVKAWASEASLFAFQDSGDGSGSPSSLRSSTINVFELPAA